MSGRSWWLKKLNSWCSVTLGGQLISGSKAGMSSTRANTLLNTATQHSTDLNRNVDATKVLSSETTVGTSNKGFVNKE